MSIEQAILEKLRALPPEKQRQVLNYASSLDTRDRSGSSASARVDFRDRSREMQWVMENRKTYGGHWVAVEGDRLIASDLDARVVLIAVRAAGIERPFLTYIDPEDSPPFGGW
jgi:hypothetical protein